jgi:hypothetical protein
MMTSTHKCPSCQSLNTRRAKNSELPEATRFPVIASRLCRDCGHVWEPEASVWHLALGVFIGAVFTVLGVVIIVQSHGSLGGTTAVTLGSLTVAGCLRRWAMKRNHRTETHVRPGKRA